MLPMSRSIRYPLTICLLIFLLVPAFGLASERKTATLADRFYENPDKSPLNTLAPNAFLVRMAPLLKPGRVLDVAMGQGRNAIYLAQHGWQVTGFDISKTGITKALEEAKRLGLSLDAQVVSGEDFDFGKERWDLVVLCYIDSRAWLDRIARSVKPGGAILLEYFHTDTKKMRPLPGNDNKTFDSNELLHLFPGFRILHYEDVLDVPDWGNRGGKERLVRLLAQKEIPDAPVQCAWEQKIFGEGEIICLRSMQFRCEKRGWTKSGSCGKGIADPLRPEPRRHGPSHTPSQE